MTKLDYKRQLKPMYQASAKAPEVVEVPALQYLMIGGSGDPNTSPAYAAAVEALFAVAYAVKFMVKKGPLAIDYGVMPLEGLWWADDMTRFSVDNKSNWYWTMLILQPEFVTAEMVEAARAGAGRKKDLAALPRLRFDTLTEGRCAQILHIGPFSAEGPTIAALHQFIDARGTLTGKHHEIYLTDIRRADPARWKTIIRQPLK